MAIILENFSKAYDDHLIFKDFSHSFAEGSFNVILGPNGCGKSTLLNFLAGMNIPDIGEIKSSYTQIEISYVFQNYRASLLPWRTNLSNLAFPLELQGYDQLDIKKRLDEIQETIPFECPWDGYPYQLSGGQQQILAFLRALITYPKLLLVDESFSALDLENTLYMRNLIQNYYLEHQPTVIMVTHDVDEALYLAQKILVLSQAPVRVEETIENSLAYPRAYSTLTCNNFQETKKNVLEIFRRVVVENKK